MREIFPMALHLSKLWGATGSPIRRAWVDEAVALITFGIGYNEDEEYEIVETIFKRWMMRIGSLSHSLLSLSSSSSTLPTTMELNSYPPIHHMDRYLRVATLTAIDEAGRMSDDEDTQMFMRDIAIKLIKLDYSDRSMSTPNTKLQRIKVCVVLIF